MLKLKWKYLGPEARVLLVAPPFLATIIDLLGVDKTNDGYRSVYTDVRARQA